MIHQQVLDLFNKFNITMTDDQMKVYEDIYNGENVLLIAPTGTGKTEASVIPVIYRISEKRPEKIHALFITPMRALNRDLYERIERYSKAMNIDLNIRHGDSSESERREITENPPDLLITTPETLQIMLSGKKIKKHLKYVRTVIVDEIHELVGDERGWQLAVALERLERLSGKIQRIGLSATVGNEKEIAEFLSPGKEIKIVKSSLVKEMDVKVEAPDKIYEEESEKMACDPDYGSAIMHTINIVNRYRGSLIFVNTRFTAEDIGMRINRLDPSLPIGIHHGSLSKEIRMQNEQLLKEGKLKALICTSSLELGIDIGHAEYVVQFNSPRQVYRLIQRIGRSGHRLGHVSRGSIVSGNPIELEEALSIIDLYRKGWIENLRVRENPLVVLANQIISWTWADFSIDENDIYETIKKSYPFRNLDHEFFLDFLKFMDSVKLIKFDGKNVKRGNRAMKYFIDNISMIPDEKSYRVIDIANSKFIGTLDESFVSTELGEGEIFVMKGISWRVVDIQDGKILVEPVEDIGTPPRWFGEDIPVDFVVAQNVANLREKGIIPEYVNDEARKKIGQWWSLKHAGMNSIRISRINTDIIIEDTFGTKVNETLALILSYRLNSLGYSVNFSVTPYSIMISSNFPPNEKLISDILLEYNEIDLKSMIEYSRFFKYVFLYVAKKFGIVSKDYDVSKTKLEKIMEQYKDTYVFDEAIKKAAWDYLDLENTQKILEKLKNGEIKIEITEIDSSMEKLIEYMDAKVGRTRVTPTVLNAVKNRLMKNELIFACLDCKGSWTRKVEDVKDLKCIYCGSVRITVLRKYERDKLSILKNGPKNEKEKEYIEKLYRISNLIRIYKKDALLALSARGVGYDTALRILSTPHSEENMLIKDITEAELNFAKNRKYWKFS